MPGHILVVDDDPDFSQLIAHIFPNRRQYVVHGVETVDAAERFMNKNRVDVVLLDIKLPRKLGWVLLEKYGNQPSAPPIVVITAYMRSKRETREQADEMGAAYTFFKPIKPSKVRRLVEALLG